MHQHMKNAKKIFILLSLSDAAKKQDPSNIETWNPSSFTDIDFFFLFTVEILRTGKGNFEAIFNIQCEFRTPNNGLCRSLEKKVSFEHTFTPVPQPPFFICTPRPPSSDFSLMMLMQNASSSWTLLRFSCNLLLNHARQQGYIGQAVEFCFFNILLHETHNHDPITYYILGYAISLK